VAAFLHIISTSRLLRILKGDASAIIKAAAKAEQAVAWLREAAAAQAAQPHTSQALAA